MAAVLDDLRRRLLLTIGAFGALAVAACVLGPLIGSTPVHLSRALDRTVPFAANLDAQIFFIARLPRVLAAALVGSALAIAGVVFQALLRNPLASPDTLGVSAGASLGAMMAIVFHADFSMFGVTAQPLTSFAGAIGAITIVYGLSVARRRGTSATMLLLGGVAVTALLSAVIEFVRYLADYTETFRTVRWLMGSLDVAGYAPVAAALVPIAVAFACCITLPRELNLISVGAQLAEARGVEVERAERIGLLGASLATGAAVALGGPVAFVGIIVPHVVRLLVGADHRVLLPSSALFGAAFLIACDTVARTAFAPVELPVGIITAIIGGPVFLWLLFRGAR